MISVLIMPSAMAAAVPGFVAALSSLRRRSGLSSSLVAGAYFSLKNTKKHRCDW